MAARVGLALSGGATHGSFQLGALRYLYDHNVRPDIIAGCSVGALNGLMLAHDENRAMDDLDRIWLGLQRNSDMYIQQPWHRELLSLFGEVREKPFEPELDLYQVLDTLERTALSGLSGAERGFLGGAIWTVLAGPIVLVAMASQVGATTEEIRRQITNVVRLLRTALASDSLYSLGPIATLVSRNLRPSEVAATGRVVRLAVTSLDTGNLRYIDERGRFVDEPNAPAVNLIDAVMASATMPVYFEPVEMGATDRTVGQAYVDGGTREIIPIQAAIDAGADLVFAIQCSAMGVASFDRPWLMRAPGILDVSGRAVEILLDEINRDELYPRQGHGPGIRVLSVQPTFDVHSPLTVNPHLIRISRDYGWMCAADATNLDEDLELQDTIEDANRARRGIITREAWEEWRRERGKDFFDVEVARNREQSEVIRAWNESEAGVRFRELLERVGVDGILDNDPDSPVVATGDKATPHNVEAIKRAEEKAKAQPWWREEDLAWAEKEYLNRLRRRRDLADLITRLRSFLFGVEAWERFNPQWRRGTVFGIPQPPNEDFRNVNLYRIQLAQAIRDRAAEGGALPPDAYEWPQQRWFP